MNMDTFEEQRLSSAIYNGPAFWNDNFVDFADTLNTLRVTPAERTMLEEIIRSSSPSLSAESDRTPPPSLLSDSGTVKRDRASATLKQASSKQNRITKQKDRNFDRTKWNRSKAKTKSVVFHGDVLDDVSGPTTISGPLPEHEHMCFAGSNPVTCPAGGAGCVAPEMLQRQLDERSIPDPDPASPGAEFNLQTFDMPESFISIPWMWGE